ncbi:VWA domain-containing protein [candidate division KSB1 bacterium]|nr:VWA domain-containing protein [candidate division KSB1 bacterium]
MSRKNLLIYFVLMMSLSWTAQSFSVGALFVRPLRSNQTYDKMSMRKVDVQATIQDQIAATHIDQTFFNEMNQQVEAVFVFPLPEGAVVTELVYWFNGKRYVGYVREKQEAIADYNNKIRQYLDPALLQYLGNNLFRLNIAPINARTEVRFEITYTQLLNYDFGKISYLFFLKTTALSPTPLERVSLKVDLKTQAPLKFVHSPTHENSTATQMTKISDFQYQIVFGDENFHPDSDFLMEFETVRKGVDIHVLTYTPVPKDSFGRDSFYALWITPPDSINTEEIIPKNIIFTVDVSSSMEGQRIEQLRSALNNFLNYLLPIDRFNIISFGTHVRSFQPDLVAATPTNLALAKDHVRQLVALGLTNINQAVQNSLSQSFQDTTMNIVVFLTDGYPTWDETNIAKILGNAKNANKKDVHLFSFGVGKDISKALLENLSKDNGGYAQYITSDDSIALMIKNHFNRISMPVLDNLQIEIPGLLSLDRYPRPLPSLFWGSQVLELGRYSNFGTFDVTLKAKMRGKPVTYTNTINFPGVTGGCHFVPRLWAKSKIDYLYREIEIYGELAELKNAIIDLSIRYGILTSYTALYVDPEDPPPTAVEKIESSIPPETFALGQNYPNPFNPTTEITYNLAPGDNHQVVLRIYDALGRLVIELVNERQASGRYRIKWDGTNLYGQRVPSGVYIYVLEVGKVRLSRKMILTK